MADIYIGNVKGPQGDTGATGPQGAAGDAATVRVGTVSTTAYGNPAQVVNSGTEHAAILNFTIPQGAPGATVTQLDNLALNTITTSTDQYPQIQVGDTGRTIFGKIIKFFQDLVSALAEKINYSDALTMEEIEAASDLTNKVAAASAADTLKESLSTSSYSGQIVWNSAYTWDNFHYCEAHRSGKIMYLQVRAYKTSTPIPPGTSILTLPESMRPRENTSTLIHNSLYGSETNSIFGVGGWTLKTDGTVVNNIGGNPAYSCVASFVYILP